MKSDAVKKGMQQAPHRSLFNALGYTEEELKRLYKEQQESTTIRKEKKIGRNDPCPCGSGKKYKKCCGK